jgi:hypothetical protein
MKTGLTEFQLVTLRGTQNKRAAEQKKETINNDRRHARSKPPLVTGGDKRQLELTKNKTHEARSPLVTYRLKGESIGGGTLSLFSRSQHTVGLENGMDLGCFQSSMRLL